MLILDLITLTAAGLLVGNEFAIAAFVNPVLWRLPDDVHLACATALARVLGRIMPYWYASTVLLTSSAVWAVHHRTGNWPLLIGVSAGLWVVSIVYTIAALVPINNRVAAWTDENRSTEWKSFRSRWDQLHRWRVLLLTAAFLFLASGLVKQP